MKLTEHLRRQQQVYRVICAVLAFGFLLGYFWGTHSLWELSPTVIFALGALAPRKAISLYGSVYAVLLLPTLATFIERISYLWNVPQPQVVDMIFESVATLVLAWILIAAGWLLFSSRQRQHNHVS